MLSGRHIAVILASLELGGAERQALLYATHLRRVHHAEVTVCGMGPPGAVSRACDDAGIPWRTLPAATSRVPLLGAWRRRRIAAILRRLGAEILLPYTHPANLAAGLVRAACGARICLWNQRDEGLDRAPVTLERDALRGCTGMVANSPAGAAFITSILDVSAPVTVIPNAVVRPAPVADRATWRQRLGVEQQTVLVAMVANLNHQKDHATLIHAWRTVVEQLDATGITARLVLAGRPDDTADALRAAITRFSLDRHVHLAGAVSDVSGLLDACDLAVFSSRSEGCPNGVLEAMAAGLAVVGSDIAGVREVLGPDSQSCLAPAGEADALAAVIVRLVGDAGIRARIGNANRVRVTSVFSPERLCSTMDALLMNALPDAAQRKEAAR